MSRRIIKDRLRNEVNYIIQETYAYNIFNETVKYIWDGTINVVHYRLNQAIIDNLQHDSSELNIFYDESSMYRVTFIS